jgi:hypothetical protein
VLFGPVDWEGKWNRTPYQLIHSILGANTMRNARFTSRRGPDDSTAVVVFDADAHRDAAWFIAAWNASTRAGYECCAARPMTFNT